MPEVRTKRSNFKQSALASSPSVFTRRFCSSNFCGQITWLWAPSALNWRCSVKTKPGRFIDRVHFGSASLKLGRPMQKRLLLETLRRFGITPVNLLDHYVKILVHINPKLDRSSAVSHRETRQGVGHHWLE
jgi:hypothetical protein